MRNRLAGGRLFLFYFFFSLQDIENSCKQPHLYGVLNGFWRDSISRIGKHPCIGLRRQTQIYTFTMIIKTDSDHTQIRSEANSDFFLTTASHRSGV